MASRIAKNTKEKASADEEVEGAGALAKAPSALEEEEGAEVEEAEGALEQAQEVEEGLLLQPAQEEEEVEEGLPTGKKQTNPCPFDPSLTYTTLSSLSVCFGDCPLALSLVFLYFLLS